MPISDLHRSIITSEPILRPPSRKHRRRNSKAFDLTQESLEEHNRRNDAGADARKHLGSSPYYKGLTDSRLYLDRVKGGSVAASASAVVGGSSPGRESRFTSSTSGSSISTVIFKIQEWGSSCFKGKRSSGSKQPELHAPGTEPPPPASPPEQKAVGDPVVVRSRISVSSIQDVLEIGSIKGQIVKAGQRKPLRERVVMSPAKSGVGGVGGETPKEAIIVPVRKEREFVWADRYRPKALRDFICNKNRAEYLHSLVAEKRCGHFIFEGLPGVGKRTMIWAFLKENFEPENLMTKEQLKEFPLKGEALPSIKVRMKISSHHMEINLSELRGYERHVIEELLKPNDDMVVDCDSNNCQVIILYGSDRLSTDAQHYLHWVMERNKNCNKIIFCCTDVSKLQPISSLCEHIQLLPPSNNEIVEVLEFIAKQECIELPHHLAERIAYNSKQNLRQAIRSLEASWHLNYSFIENPVIMTGWEDSIANIAKSIIDEQSPKQLYIIRGKLQKLIEHNVSPDFIFSTLVEELKKHLDEKYKPKIDALYLEYNPGTGFTFDGEKSLLVVRSRPEESPRRNSDSARKNIYHFMRIEEFTAKFMSFYKACIRKNSGGSDGYES